MTIFLCLSDGETVLNFFLAHRVSAKELRSKSLNLFAIRHKCRTEIRRTRKEFSPLSPYLIFFNIPSKNNQRVTRLELAISSLGRKHSTTELHPRAYLVKLLLH